MMMKELSDDDCDILSFKLHPVGYATKAERVNLRPLIRAAYAAGLAAVMSQREIYQRGYAAGLAAGVVPREPTEVMTNEGVNVLLVTGGNLWEDARCMWRAMYDAAPRAEPPKAEQHQRDGVDIAFRDKWEAEQREPVAKCAAYIGTGRHGSDKGDIYRCGLAKGHKGEHGNMYEADL